MKPKLTMQSSLQEIFDDPKFDELVLNEIKDIQKQVSTLKRVKGGVKDFLDKFTIEEIKYQYIRIANRKSYCTTIQKQLIKRIVSKAAILTVQFYSIPKNNIVKEELTTI